MYAVSEASLFHPDHPLRRLEAGPQSMAAILDPFLGDVADQEDRSVPGVTSSYVYVGDGAVAPMHW